MSKLGKFAEDIASAKYYNKDLGENCWGDVANRVIPTVFKSAKRTVDIRDVQDTVIDMAERRFMPGGRYCYATGRPFAQTQNCLLLRAHDSREGWADLLYKGAMALMTGAGVGVAYGNVREEGAIIKKTGGFATGPLALAQMFNESGRGIMQGGARRAAIWAGLPWDHPDCHKFIRIKDWSPEVRKLKEADFSFPAMLDHTNVSIQLTDLFFTAYHDSLHSQHVLAHSIYWAGVAQMLKTAEPGFSIDIEENTGEDLRNAPVAGDTQVLTKDGYKKVIDLVGKAATLWTGLQWSEATFKRTKTNTETLKVEITGDRAITCDPSHEFFVRRYKGGGWERTCVLIKTAARDLQKGDYLDVCLPIVDKEKFDKDDWTRGFCLGDGSNKEVTLCGPKIKLLPLLQGVRTIGQCARGYKRIYLDHEVNKTTEGPFKSLQSFLAGWFDADGSYDKKQRKIRLSGGYDLLVEARRLLETLGIISTISKPTKSGYGGKQDTRNLIILQEYAPEFQRLIDCKRLSLKVIKPYRGSELKVISVTQGAKQDVYCCDVGVEEHSFVAEGVRISNCCEITTRDSDDVCNLGSVNMGSVDTIEQFADIVRRGTMFLLAGTIYSDIPYHEVDVIRSKNRRLGLGLMGMHEWLLKRGKRYGPDDELAEWLSVYRDVSRKTADDLSADWRISSPAKVRAIAPTGTIGIVAETSTGIEPVFCVAYKRRYLKDGKTWVYQYVVDPVAKRLIDQGVNPDSIEDAYSLADNVERRVEFQAFVQDFVDHGISSTINLPFWGHKNNNKDLVKPFGDMLMKYLPRLRGVTTYPDAARGGQPLTPVKYETAMKHEGQVVEESVNLCDITGRGSCGE